MDQQNSRVGGKQIRERAEDDMAGREKTASLSAAHESIEGTPDARSGMTGSSPQRRVGGTEYSTPATADEPPDRSTREIREEIEQTREDMSETVNAIQERLRPATIASNAAENVKHAARAKMREVADSDSITYMTANPIPTAMVGIGLAGLVWLTTAGRDGRSIRSRHRRGYFGDQYDRSRGLEYGRDRESYSRGRTTVGETGAYALRSDRPDADDLWDDRTPSEGTGYAGRRSDSTDWSRPTSGGAGRTTQAYRSTQNYLQNAWSESPLLVGAASAVLGAIVGLGLPETEHENQLMGEARDNMMESVQETVREKVDQVQQAATNAVSSVQDAAKSVVGLTGSGEASSEERRSGGSS